MNHGVVPWEKSIVHYEKVGFFIWILACPTIFKKDFTLANSKTV